jgi:hypothetical protein
MHVVVFDCRDAPRPELAVVTLRVVTDDGLIALQSIIYRGDPRQIAEAIAAGLGAELRWVGLEAGEAKPALCDRVVLCTKCGKINGWVSRQSTGYAKQVAEWTADGLSPVAMSTDDVRRDDWCSCNRKPAQQALF